MITAPLPDALPDVNFSFVTVDGPYVAQPWRVGPPDSPADRGVLVIGWTDDEPLDLARATAIANHGLLRWWPLDALACDVDGAVVAWVRLEHVADTGDRLVWRRSAEPTTLRAVIMRAVVAPDRCCTCPYHPELRRRARPR